MSEEKFNGIVIDDGTERVPIKNLRGEEIGFFYFNPSDIGIVKRYNKAVPEIEKIIQDMTAENVEDETEMLFETERRLGEQFNYIFGGDMVEAFFGKISMWALVGGEFYCWKALDLLGEFITKKFEAEIKKANEKIEKYTHGYRTGAHKDGKK